jgi:FMN-dependent NADH-azoreductase
MNMSTLLQINTSLHSERGQSSLLAGQFADKWQRANPDGRVIVRDLAADPVPHLTAERFDAFATPADQRTPEQAAHAAASDNLIDELKSADIVALGLPMYNFGIPSPLKAWIDHIGRAGVTFKYTDNGPVGLLADRKVYVFAARGGLYKGTEHDTQSVYIRNFLNFVGIQDIEFVYAEGLAMSGGVRQQSLDVAARTIDRLAA